MLLKFKDHINQNFSFLKEKKLLIAISGGVDSVVLTHLLSKLNYNIALAHCNFQLRGIESDLDEQFVKELGKQLQLKTHTIQFEIKKIAKESKTSTQIIARELRYNWFEKLSQENGFDFILTAHHLNDSLETFIINLTRGAGLKGVTGIPSQNGNIFRPLLIFTREEIKNYAIENNIEWREDASNSETKYVRNKIRHEIVPKLLELNPNLLESFGNTLEFLKESQQIVEDKIVDVSKEVIRLSDSAQGDDDDNYLQIDIEKIKKLSNPKAYLYQLLHPYGFTEWNDVENLLTSQSGKQVFSNTHRLIKNRNFLLLSTKNISEDDSITVNIQENETEITHPLHLKFVVGKKESSKSKNTIFVDKDLLKYPLLVRKWQKGDYFCPLGMQGRKKLSKYFKDEKLSLLEKENTWLLCNSENKIIWVIGKRQDNRYIPTKTTKNYIKITIN